MTKIISLLMAFVMLLSLASCTTPTTTGEQTPSTTPDETSESSKPIESSESEPEKTSFDETEVISQLEYEEFSYVNSIDSTVTNLIITNNSEYDLSLEVSVILKDSDGKNIGAKNTTINAFEKKTTTYYEFRNDDEYESIEVEFTPKEEDYYKPVISNISTEVSTTDSKAIISFTNNGELPAQFVEYNVLFFSGDTLVYSEGSYAADDDSELKSGKTITKEAESFVPFDNVEVYFTGRAE